MANKANNTDNGKVVRKLLFVVIGMFGFGFTLVPLYDVFCDITGLNGKTSGERFTEDAPIQVDTTREIKVEFLANLNDGMPWKFEPVTDWVTVHPGEATRVEYIVRNNTDKDMIGQAIPSVSPGLAAGHFQKTECFCFTEQVLKAGEEKKMPVVFMIDPSIDHDIGEVTLSYTFFIKPGSEDAKSARRHTDNPLSGPHPAVALSTPLTQN